MSTLNLQNFVIYNCVKITNNSLKLFGNLFDSKIKNPYKSIHYKFSDNSIDVQNSRNPHKNLQKPKKNKHILELISNFSFRQKFIIKIYIKI